MSSRVAYNTIHRRIGQYKWATEYVDDDILSQKTQNNKDANNMFFHSKSKTKQSHNKNTHKYSWGVRTNEINWHHSVDRRSARWRRWYSSPRKFQKHHQETIWKLFHKTQNILSWTQTVSEMGTDFIEDGWGGGEKVNQTFLHSGMVRQLIIERQLLHTGPSSVTKLFFVTRDSQLEIQCEPM